MVLVRTGGRKSLREGGSTPASPTQKLGQFSGSRAGPLTPVSVLQGDGGHKQAFCYSWNAPQAGLGPASCELEGKGQQNGQASVSFPHRTALLQDELMGALSLILSFALRARWL